MTKDEKKQSFATDGSPKRKNQLPKDQFFSIEHDPINFSHIFSPPMKLVVLLSSL